MGGSLTGVTVTVKNWVTVFVPGVVGPSSLTVTVIVEVPLRFAVGVKVSEAVLPGLL